MTLIQRIQRVVQGLLLLLGAFLMIKMEEEGYLLVSLLLSASLILYGLRSLIFYFTMARHMVDGRSVLFRGVIVLDFGIFTMSISQNFNIFIVVYLLAFHAFSGVLDILRALEARHYQAPSWRMNLAEGVLNIVFAAAAVIFGLFQGNMKDLTLIYAIGLLNAAVVKFVTAFRKTAIVYIQ